MATVVQSRYRPQQAPAVVGLVSDEVGWDSVTRQVETSAGVTFGVAVSQGALDRGVVLGGENFVGVVCRSVTLDGRSIDPLGLVDINVDTYEVGSDCCVLTRGRIWVTADAPVSAGDPLYFDAVTGGLTNSADGSAAHGYYEFTTQPIADLTLIVNGVTFTFKDSGATGAQVNIGPTLSDTIMNIADVLNTSASGSINVATYEAWPPSPGGRGQGSGAYRLNISYDAVGTAGNSFALNLTGTYNTANYGVTRSAATLTGGYAGALASGSIVFSGQPTADKKITLNGTDVTFGPGNDVAIGGDLDTTMDSLVTFLNGSADDEIKKCTYAGHGTAGSYDGITITSDTLGTAMNSFTLATDDPAGTVSYVTLTGGEPKSTAVTYGTWLTSAITGDLAIVNLSLQR